MLRFVFVFQEIELEHLINCWWVYDLLRFSVEDETQLVSAVTCSRNNLLSRYDDRWNLRRGHLEGCLMWQLVPWYSNLARFEQRKVLLLYPEWLLLMWSLWGSCNRLAGQYLSSSYRGILPWILLRCGQLFMVLVNFGAFVKLLNNQAINSFNCYPLSTKHRA